jgi:8-oxo-dGTP pyrophosphatase MutT (NUDIX family)
MVARRHTASVVAPRTVTGKFILIRQERIAVQRVLWEFPAGQVDGEVNEVSIYQTALRELGEEAGVVSERWFPWLFFSSDLPTMLPPVLASDVVRERKASITMNTRRSWPWASFLRRS